MKPKWFACVLRERVRL